MTAKLVFICDICGMEKAYSGPKTKYYFCDTWLPIPGLKKDLYLMDRYYDPHTELNPLMHQWVCSLECADKWTDKDPEHNFITHYDPPDLLRCIDSGLSQKEQAQEHSYEFHHNWHLNLVVLSTKDYVWSEHYDTMYSLETGFFHDCSGPSDSGCYTIRIREKDRVRLVNINSNRTIKQHAEDKAIEKLWEIRTRRDFYNWPPSQEEIDNVDNIEIFED